MNTFKILRDNLYVLITGDYIPGKIDLNDLANPALGRFTRKAAFGGREKEELPELTEEEEKALRTFWRPYVLRTALPPYNLRMSDRFHRYYKKHAGYFDPRFIPEDFMFMYVDRTLTDRTETKYVDHKGLYYRLFRGIAMPEAYAVAMGGVWLDGEGNPADTDELVKRINARPEVVVKEATGSEMGQGVRFFKGSDVNAGMLKALAERKCDIVIQKPLRQHPVLASLNESSVNTLRIITLLRKGEVKVCARVLRIGSKGSRVDNVHAGGMLVGVNPDGSLMETGYTKDMTPVTSVPGTGAVLAGTVIPGTERADALVKKAHLMVARYRLVSWDIAIDEAGEPELIEANFSLGMVREPQICCGPLFGDETGEILDEIFGVRRK